MTTAIAESAAARSDQPAANTDLSAASPATIAAASTKRETSSFHERCGWIRRRMFDITGTKVISDELL
jgi:hypothetical protein